MGLTAGGTYRGENVRFLLASFFASLDYEKVWPYPSPEPLRWKVEFSLGGKGDPPHEGALVASAVMFAQYYLRGLESERFHPFVEGGIGLIYTDYKVEGQGLRLNFNPNLGAGFDIGSTRSPSAYLVVRLHHVSNGDLNRDNTGLNSMTFSLGFYL